ncbi:pyrophosphatase PpaX [Cohnella caldifontis]|uniref:pyrophosphatase PpaX n=1 Tax=Cohnella caldifontis TaxID=3027471 RepID=UPI0023ECCDE2|nr:pyrophosphatase PpaX [Cohnella sp. YIM B05605]
MTKETEAVLFDLDGTIIDTNELIIQSFLHALKGRMPDDFGREDIIPHMGKTLTDQLRLFSGEQDVTGLMAAYREYNLQYHDEMVGLFPGVAEVVPVLKREGIKLGIVTTKMRASTERALRLFGLWDQMDAIVTLDDVEHAKPHPEPVLKAMEAVGAKASGTIMVGDSAVDIESAIRAGAVPVGVAWSLKGEAVLRDAGAEHVLQDMNQLLTLCGIEGAKA